MTETEGLIAGVMLLFALFLYTFWPENAFASQKEKTQLDFLLERKEQLYENLRDLTSNIAPASIPKRISSLSAHFWNTRPHSCWQKSTFCRAKEPGFAEP